ncbi:hypothetical protein BGW38_010676 [Lunasporangiospora selenospora]|uniref:BZIP domain-containing protein n=1 Tax=Lunasporangiospora selenospora TaxID=979761 RepID=A0A9P6KHR3_9FUNG|nr:hypothetical protein BGW38_010676 [Lunasporangiospora selenospora]
MAISIDLPMFDLNDPKLTKSADALESALAQLGKNSTPVSAAETSLLASAVANDGNGFDEWLAADLQLGGLLSSDEASSLTSSPYSALDDSPILGFDSFANSSLGSSLFDLPLALPTTSTETSAIPSAVSVSLPVPFANMASVVTAPVHARPVLTTDAVKQAAAALNIPWSHDLELAVMAQAANNAIPVLSLNTTPAMVIPKIEPTEQCFTPIVLPETPLATSPVFAAASVAIPVSTSVSTESAATSNKKRAASPDDEADEVVAKRAKNTDAARRSRLKKLLRLEGLEAKVSELEVSNNKLTMKVAILETEKNGHLVKEAEQSTRIAQLEAKLAEAHAALTSRV